MNNILKIKDMVIGSGAPKICVPMVGKNKKELLEEAKYIKELDFDLVEWRGDFYDEVLDVEAVKTMLKEIKNILSHKPLLFTFRSKREGGELEISSEYYFELAREVSKTKLAELIDIELFNEEEEVISIIKKAHENGTKVIVSNHDFSKTPDKHEIIARLKKAQELGGDIPKIAVMPNSLEDVITLLDATKTFKESHKEVPIVTMSMAKDGVITRIAGEVFGSSITFGAAKKVSAPGQMELKDLRTITEILHKYL